MPCTTRTSSGWASQRSGVIQVEVISRFRIYRSVRSRLAIIERSAAATSASGPEYGSKTSLLLRPVFVQAGQRDLDALDLAGHRVTVHLHEEPHLEHAHGVKCYHRQHTPEHPVVDAGGGEEFIAAPDRQADECQGQCHGECSPPRQAAGKDSKEHWKQALLFDGQFVDRAALRLELVADSFIDVHDLLLRSAASIGCGPGSGVT